MNAANSRGRIDVILEALVDELADGNNDKERLIQRCGLDGFLWKQAGRVYGYESEAPGVHDFVIALFKSAYAAATDETAGLNSEAQVFLKRWKDSLRIHKSFEKMSRSCADQLGIRDDLATREYSALREVDCFEVIDRKILSELAREVSERLIAAEQCMQFVRSRRNTHWFANYKHEYGAIEAAARFMVAVDQIALEIDGFEDGIRKYTETWWKIDSLYRTFFFHKQASGGASLLDQLATEVEQRYSNQFLLPLADRWQGVVDALERWFPESPQKQFFHRRVKSPFLEKKRKVCVIISDGLRYEVGQEFTERIRQENRYSAELDHMVTGLPSFTQLGMAALLPNQTLELTDKGNVLIDGRSSAGIENRSAQLDSVPGKRGIAIRAKDLLEMTANESRGLFRDHDFVYVYHNVIDAIGDKQQSESRVFSACEQTVQELVQLVKKLTSANASNILVTSDHGFLYQNGVEESDFSAPEANVSAEVRNRRFLLGRELESQPGLRHFSSDKVGLTGDVDVVIPKGINRLRRSGAGYRYVHGGCTLQEVVVPVIEINKSKKDDVSRVPVEFIPGSSSKITTNQLIVRLYQSEACTEKLQARTLTVGLFAGMSENAVPISDTFEVLFDSGSENPRDREHAVKLVLSRDADEYKGQQVYLLLRERIGSTSHFQNYKDMVLSFRVDRDLDF